MAGKKKESGRLYHPNWGGKRNGAGARKKANKKTTKIIFQMHVDEKFEKCLKDRSLDGESIHQTARRILIDCMSV